jgi:hypothetical protein
LQLYHLPAERRAVGLQRRPVLLRPLLLLGDPNLRPATELM